LAWGEKDGTVTNSERTISRQRPLFDAPGEARGDWWIVSEVARRMGHGAAFTFDRPADIFREYARQTAFRNDGSRKLDLGAWADLSDADYEHWLPARWGGLSPFADGRFTTADGRARLVPVEPGDVTTDPDFPMRLNTGRYRDQWHTMTRTGLSPRLSQHRREPLVEVHPADAAANGLAAGGLARVVTPQGESVFRVDITDGQRSGEIFVPMHWTDQMANGGRANRLPTQNVDPVSGQPGFKNSAARIEPVVPEWRAFLVAADMPSLPPGLLYWSRSKVAGGWLIELAGEGAVDVDALLPRGERLEAMDMVRGMRRIAVRGQDERLAAAMFLTRSGVLPDRGWIAAQLDAASSAEALSWLAARPKEAGPDRGAIVCVCFDVGMKTILSAIAGQGLTSVESVGAALNAGTNCGSCRPAIARLLTDVPQRLEAAG
jgi:assimilatory nitrate reductase catalytic subunit